MQQTKYPNILKAILILAWLSIALLTGVPAACAGLHVETVPAWINKGSGIEGEELVGVGVAQGAFADERGAYLDALQSMTQVIRAHVRSLQKQYMSDFTGNFEKAEVKQYVEESVKVSSDLVQLTPGLSCALLLKVYQAEITAASMDTDMTPSRFAWQEQEQRSQPTPGTTDIRQRSQRVIASADLSKGGIEESFSSIGRCQVALSDTVMARLPITQRYVQRRLDGSAVTYVQVRVPLQTVLAEVQANREPQDAAAADPWGEATWAVGKHAVSSQEVAPTISYASPVCTESWESRRKQVPKWVTEKGAAFPGERRRFYGVGSATAFASVRAQRRLAEALARADLAASLQYTFETVTRRSSPDNPLEDTMKQMTAMGLLGSSVREYWEHPCTGEGYALATIDASHVRLLSEALGLPIPAWAEGESVPDQLPTQSETAGPPAMR